MSEQTKDKQPDGDAGKERFVDAAADSLKRSLAEARRALSAIEMCRDESKGGHALDDADIPTTDAYIKNAEAQMRHIKEKLSGELAGEHSNADMNIPE